MFRDTIAVIPARYHSTRLPGKLMQRLGDVSVLEYTYRNVCDMNLFDKVVIACDPDIWDKIDFDCNKELSKSIHANGTSRIGEVAMTMDYPYIVNIQGDEPFIGYDAIVALVQALRVPNTDISSTYTRIKDRNLLFDFSVVKVVCTMEEKALYFSRQAIPAHRDFPFDQWFDQTSYYRHLGMYGFRREVLLDIAGDDIDQPYSGEMLEQLAWLYKGYTIRMAEVDAMPRGIDTQGDLDAARSLI